MDAIGFDPYNCVIEVIGADIYNLALTGDKACSLTRGGWTSTGTCPKVLILDHHPNDSRTDIAEDQQAVQTLTSRMGTGGGNVPMILEYHSQALRIKPLEDDVSPTIPAGFGEGGANTTTPCLIVEPIPLEGNGARPSHRGDGYRKAGPMYSLNTTEVHSIAYAFEPGILKREGKENRVCENDPTLKIDTEGVGFSLRAREFKDPQIVCYAEKRFCEWYEDKKGVTLRASSGSYGGGSEVLVCTREQSEHCAEQTTSGFSNNK